MGSDTGNAVINDGADFTDANEVLSTDEDVPLIGNVLTGTNSVVGPVTVSSFEVDGNSYATGTTATITGVGTLLIESSGAFTFTPDANWNGTVPTVTYTLGDGQHSDTSTLNITVKPVDDPSVLANDSDSAAEDNAVLGNVLENDDDIDSDLLVASFTVDTNGDGVAESFTAGESAVIAGKGSLTLGEDGEYNFTPQDNWSGEVPKVTYTTNTGSSAELAITVSPVADAPALSLVSNDVVSSINFEDVALPSKGWDGDVAINGVSGASTIGSWNTLNGDGTVEVGRESIYVSGGDDSNKVLEIEGNAGDSTLFTTFHAEAGSFFELEFDIAARSGNVASSGLTISIFKLDGAGNPIAGSEKVLYTFDPTTGGWVRDQQVGISIDSSGDYRLVFTAENADTYGAILDNIKFSALDNKGYEDTFFNLSEIHTALTDTDGSEVLSVEISGLPEGAILKDGNGNEATVGADGKLDVTGWQLDALQIMVDEPGNYTLTVTSTSSEMVNGSVVDSASSQTSFPITVLDMPEPPTVSISNAGDVAEGSVAAFTVSLSAAASTAVTVKLTLDAGDTEGGDLGNLVVKLANGTVVVANPDGSYTIPAGQTQLLVSVPTLQNDVYEGREAFSIKVEAVTGATGEGVGQAAIVDSLRTVADSASVLEGSVSHHASVLLNDPVADGISLSVAQVKGSAAGAESSVGSGGTVITTALGGSVTIYADGSYDYTAPVLTHGVSNTQTDSFWYKASDGSASSAWTQVAIGVNDSTPVAVDDYVVGSQSSSTISGNVLGNDAAIDGIAGVTKFTYGGTTYTFGSATSLTTSDGRFTMESDGDFTFNRTVEINGANLKGVSVAGILGGLPGSVSDAMFTTSASNSVTYNGSGTKYGWGVSLLNSSRNAVDTGETMLMDLGGQSSKVLLGIGELNNNSSVLVAAYDANGNQITLKDSQIIPSELSNNSGHLTSFYVEGVNGEKISYIALSATGTGQGYVVESVSFSLISNDALVTYTVKDGDGDTGTANLVLNVAEIAGRNGNDQITVRADGKTFDLQLGAYGDYASAQTTQTTASVDQVIDSKGGNDYVESGSGNDTIYLGDSGANQVTDNGVVVHQVADQSDVAKVGLMTINSLADLVNSDNTLSQSARAYGSSTALSWADVAHGGEGNDQIFGQNGVDLIYGGAGNDKLFGGAGDDGLRGGAGDDLLVGGAGNDILRGDSGVDTFKWQLGDQGTTANPAQDIIKDFQTGVGGDVLDLQDLLQGENSSNLGNYLHFTSDSAGNAVVQISSSGNISSGHDQTITLQNVQLGTLGSGDADIINKLLTSGNLKTDL